jgi:hypothetical protein
MRFFHSVGLERTSGNRIHPQIELSFTEFKPLMVSARMTTEDELNFL